MEQLAAVFLLKPVFHVVVTGLSQSLEYLGRWESLPVVGGLSGPLTVSFMVVNGLSKSLFKLLLLAPNLLPFVGGLSGSLAVAKGILCCFHMTQMKRQGRWRFFMVVHGRWDRL